MNLGHPVLQEMLSMGCNRDNDIILSFQTYMELCEVQVAKTVEYHYSTEVDLIYLLAVDETEEVFVPVPAKQPITPNWIQKIHKFICGPRQIKGFNLVVRDSDTTSVTYKVMPGLVPPPSPEMSKLRREQDEKEEMIRAELRSRLPSLYEQAQAAVD